MNTAENPHRSQLLAALKAIQPVVIDPTVTFDMGIECTIVTTDGVVYAEPGMFLFCGGNWPINVVSRDGAEGAFSLNTGEAELLFTDVGQLELAFIEMFELDALWEELSDSELRDWSITVASRGIRIASMSDGEEEK